MGDHIAAPAHAPEKKAFVLVTLASPPEVEDRINQLESQNARTFALQTWKINNRIITWACPELADRILPEERAGLQTLLSALEGGTLPESRVVGPDYKAFMITTGSAIAPAQEVQKVSFARPIGVPLEICVLDDYGNRQKGVAPISGDFNIKSVLGQWVASLNATDLTGTFPERSLNVALVPVSAEEEKPRAAPRRFVYDV